MVFEGIPAACGRRGTRLVPVALKRAVRLHEFDDIAFVQRAEISLLNEAVIGQYVCGHPHLIGARELVTDNAGVKWIAMDLVRGTLLSAAVRRQKPPLLATTEILRQVCLGMYWFHICRDGKKPLRPVHRDLKPGNIMLTPNGNVRVFDFGIVQFENCWTQNTNGAVLGSVPFMSPEQAGDYQIDYRSDIFSLGTILYGLVVGRRAFCGPNVLSVMTDIAQNSRTDRVKEVRDIHPELGALLHACWRQRPHERPVDMHAIARKLYDIQSAMQCNRSGREQLVSWLAHQQT